MAGSIEYGAFQKDCGIALRSIAPDTVCGALPLPLANVVHAVSNGCGPSPYCSCHVYPPPLARRAATSALTLSVACFVGSTAWYQDGESIAAVGGM